MLSQSYIINRAKCSPPLVTPTKHDCCNLFASTSGKYLFNGFLFRLLVIVWYANVHLLLEDKVIPAPTTQAILPPSLLRGNRLLRLDNECYRQPIQTHPHTICWLFVCLLRACINPSLHFFIDGQIQKLRQERAGISFRHFRILFIWTYWVWTDDELYCDTAVQYLMILMLIRQKWSRANGFR